MSSEFDEAPEIRLVAADMDGTLLDGEGNVPDDLWPLLEVMAQRGIAFAPASGRQYATLRSLFHGRDEGMVYVAENGTYVVRDGQELSSDAMDAGFVADLVRELRALPHDIGVVVCGKRSAYIERGDDAFRAEASRYYAELALVDDLLTVDDQILKIAVYAFEGGERTTAPALAHHREAHQVVVSGAYWVDVMNAGVDKGRALAVMQERLGITPAQTVAFGDYLNDIEMMDAAEFSFAMANAHPDLAARARYRAPSNTENGVVRVLERLLGVTVSSA